MQTNRECFCVSSRVWPRSFPECECCWFVPRSWGTRGHSCFCQRCSSADPWLPPTEHTQKLIKTKYKAGFLKSFNSIFGKIGQSTSEEVLFELIKSKWLPILLYSTNVCPMNSAGRHSLQFTINNIVYKIFGAMSKDLYIEISGHFGIESVENLVAIHRNCSIMRYGETDNYLCQMLRWLIRLSMCTFIYCACLISVCQIYSFMLC